MEDGQVAPTRAGTPQGAVISPLLANIYLHYVFDLWAQQWRKRHARGNVILVRYADDIVVGFERKADAERFKADLKERMARFALALHPDKTRLIEFGRFAAGNRERRGLAGRLPQAGRLGPIIWWLAGGLILGLVRRFVEGFNGAPLAVVGLIEIEPNHAHKPFLRPIVGRFP